MPPPLTPRSLSEQTPPPSPPQNLLPPTLLSLTTFSPLPPPPAMPGSTGIPVRRQPVKATAEDPVRPPAPPRVVRGRPNAPGAPGRRPLAGGPGGAGARPRSGRARSDEEGDEAVGRGRAVGLPPLAVPAHARGGGVWGRRTESEGQRVSGPSCTVLYDMI